MCLVCEQWGPPEEHEKMRKLSAQPPIQKFRQTPQTRIPGILSQEPQFPFQSSFATMVQKCMILEKKKHLWVGGLPGGKSLSRPREKRESGWNWNWYWVDSSLSAILETGCSKKLRHQKHPKIIHGSSQNSREMAIQIRIRSQILISTNPGPLNSPPPK